MAKSTSHNGRGARAEAAAAVEEQVEKLRESASEYLDEGRAKAEELGQALQERIRRDPLTALLLAIGLGFVLGYLWIRRR